MQEFIAKYKDEIEGKVSGWDRLVLAGTLRRLDVGQYLPKMMKAQRAAAMEQYCWQNDILFKDYFKHVKTVSERVKEASAEPFRRQNLPVLYLPSPKMDKNEVARQVASERGIQEGLVCAISSTELHATFEHRNTFLVRRKRPCHVLYHYMIHPELGRMYARVQTWFPFQIRVGLNGREWLAQQRFGLSDPHTAIVKSDHSIFHHHFRCYAGYGTPVCCLLSSVFPLLPPSLHALNQGCRAAGHAGASRIGSRNSAGAQRQRGDCQLGPAVVQGRGPQSGGAGGERHRSGGERRGRSHDRGKSDGFAERRRVDRRNKLGGGRGRVHRLVQDRGRALRR